MPREYDTFVDDPSVLPDGGEIDLTIRELTPDDRRDKYRSKFVRAHVAHSADPAKDDLLWVRLQRGPLQKKPLAIKILKVFGSFQNKPGVGIKR